MQEQLIPRQLARTQHGGLRSSLCDPDPGGPATHVRADDRMPVGREPRADHGGLMSAEDEGRGTPDLPDAGFVSAAGHDGSAVGRERGGSDRASGENGEDPAGLGVPDPPLAVLAQSQDPAAVETEGRPDDGPRVARQFHESTALHLPDAPSDDLAGHDATPVGAQGRVVDPGPGPEVADEPSGGDVEDASALDFRAAQDQEPSIRAERVVQEKPSL